MKKLAAAFLLLLVSLNSFADTAFTSLEDVFAFVSTYYIEPRPEAIHASFDYLVSSSYPIASSAMMMQFYAVVLKEDDVLLETIVGGLARTPSVEEKIFILHILAEMGTPDSVTYLDRAREEWQDGKVQAALIHIDETRPVGLFQQEPENSDALDRLWGYFWA